VTRRRRPSAQTRAVLDLLESRAEEWCHGYELSRDTGIASGTLYPLLMRLAARGYLESRWELAPVAGRPARHLYRLSAAGRMYAAEAAAQPSPRHAVPRPARGGA
jgi:DNA-binding PadR family transcriptional regulator